MPGARQKMIKIDPLQKNTYEIVERFDIKDISTIVVCNINRIDRYETF